MDRSAHNEYKNYRDRLLSLKFTGIETKNLTATENLDKKNWNQLIVNH